MKAPVMTALAWTLNSLLIALVATSCSKESFSGSGNANAPRPIASQVSPADNPQGNQTPGMNAPGENGPASTQPGLTNGGQSQPGSINQGGDSAPGTSGIQVGQNQVQFGGDKVFHIGDGKFEGSSCRSNITAYPLSGTVYQFTFSVPNNGTTATISVQELCGVDYADSNYLSLIKDGQVISSQLLSPGATAASLPAVTLSAGTYAVVVKSAVNYERSASGDADDFLVGLVNVSADQAITAGSVSAQ